ERVDYQPVDLEAVTRDALAYLAKFRDVLEEGTLEQRKEFLRGFVHEICIDPDTARGVITFYELPISSLMMVPGARVALLKTFRSKRLDGFSLPKEAWRLAGRLRTTTPASAPCAASPSGGTTGCSREIGRAH